MQNLLLYGVGALFLVAIIFQILNVFYFQHRRERHEQPVTDYVVIQEANDHDPVEIFTGKAEECALVKSLLENAEINAYEFYSGGGSMAVGDSLEDRVMVARNDLEKGKEVILQYREAMKSQVAPDSD